MKGYVEFGDVSLCFEVLNYARTIMIDDFLATVTYILGKGLVNDSIQIVFFVVYNLEYSQSKEKELDGKELC